MNLPAKHILFITSTNLACNPRCLKEVRLAYSLGFKITVVAFNLHNWTSEKEAELNKEFPDVDFTYLETTKKHFSSWLFSSIIEKASHKIANKFPTNVFLQATAISKRSWILLQWIKKWNGKADLIIAHNPPAFYPAYKLALKLKKPFGVDVEDFHPGEGNDITIHKSVTSILQLVFKKAAYISYASQLIKKYTEELLTEKNNAVSFVINNVFAKDDFPFPAQQNFNKIKFVWFSQNIDYGRGLEQLIPAMEGFQDQIELTLIGNFKEVFYNDFINGRKFIKINPPLNQKDLHRSMHDYDIGLAIEPGKDINNKIALSNKIWTYFQAGLFIFASNTEAQKQFITSFPGHGLITSLEKQDVIHTIKLLMNQITAIRLKKELRFEEAKKNSWETESKILAQKWEAILS
jgi:hypothetical protein